MGKPRLTAVFFGTVLLILLAVTLCYASPFNSPEVDSVTDEVAFTSQQEPANDPLEPVNRAFFVINDTMYFWLLKPVARVLDTFVPIDVRIAVRNALNNITAPVRVVNNLLQGKFKETGTELSRFVINSTVGIVGLGDPAANEFGILAKEEDFGQTMGNYGVGAGIYICWPLLGPSNFRDTLGVAVDSLLNPLFYFGEDGYASAGFSVGKRLNHISLNLEEYDDFKKAAIDPYVSLRDAYLQHRISQIEDKGAEAETVPYSGAE